MSTLAGTMRQEGSGLSAQVYHGWSWPAFFFNCLWYMYKGMWVHGLVLFVVNLATVGLAWALGLIIVPLVANKQHQEWLASRGYRMT